MDTHESMMELAIKRGSLSLPYAGINPAVGAVVAKDGKILGMGFHRGPGTPHAEIEAMNEAVRSSGRSEALRGADLYSTLEPCCHEGPPKRTGPCTRAIIEAGIARVFFACSDPNPSVAGRGAEILRKAGVAVTEGLLESRARPLIKAFSVSVSMKRPFVRIKWAQSLDGRIACASGESKWITCEAARADARGLRAAHDAVLVGAGTLIADDPELTARSSGAREPLRIVLAGRRALPEGAKAFTGANRATAIVVAPKGSPAAIRSAAQGIRLVEAAAGKDGAVDLKDALGKLYDLGIGSLLVEGGPAVISSFLREGIADALAVYCAPTLIGEGACALGDLGVRRPPEALRFSEVRYSQRDGYLRVDLECLERAPSRTCDGEAKCSRD